MIKQYQITLIFLIFILDFGLCSYQTQEFKVGNQEKIEVNECTKVVFRTQYKRAIFEISNPYDMSAILFTDQEIDIGTCGHTDLYEKCKTQSNLCSYSTDISTEIAYESGFCAKNIYMYLESSSIEAELFVQSAFVDPMDDKSELHVCNKINDYDPFIKCASVPLSDCKDECIFGCDYVACKENGKEKVGMCLPNTLSDSENLQQCQVMTGINSYEIVNQCDSYYKEAKAEVRDHPWIIYVVFILMAWIATIIYYNYKLEQTGIPPFPTFCCPEICYPRARIYPEQYFQDSEDKDYLKEGLNP